MAGHFMSMLQDLIPEAIFSQKYHLNIVSIGLAGVDMVELKCYQLTANSAVGHVSILLNCEHVISIFQ
jgi:hypothetical protein